MFIEVYLKIIKKVIIHKLMEIILIITANLNEIIIKQKKII
jgi:hypothetical protein